MKQYILSTFTTPSRRLIILLFILFISQCFINAQSNPSSATKTTTTTSTNNDVSPSKSNSDLLLIPPPFTNYSVPLFAHKFSHHVHIYIGFPPQRRVVIVDTGSRILVFPCNPCSHCGLDHVSGAHFSRKISTTDLKHNCDTCSLKSLRSVSNDILFSYHGTKLFILNTFKFILLFLYLYFFFYIIMYLFVLFQLI